MVTKTKNEVKFINFLFPVDTLFEKGTLCGHTSYVRRIKTYLIFMWSIPQSLGCWSHSQHCLNTQLYSIPYHAIKCLYEWSNRNWISCPHAWHGIFQVSPLLTYHVFKKDWSKLNEISHQCFFEEDVSEVGKTLECSKVVHTYCEKDHARDIPYRYSITSTDHLFNGTVINWCGKNQSKTSRSSYNTESISMYTGVLDKNWTICFHISTSYPIVPPSKLY